MDSADAIQSLSFALCHVYARSTRSVSIPAPVYCESLGAIDPVNLDTDCPLDADIVCARAKNHYDPDSAFDLSETASHADSTQANASLDAYRSGFRPLNKTQEKRMYFSVSSRSFIIGVRLSNQVVMIPMPSRHLSSCR